jgi:hypothetical protein
MAGKRHVITDPTLSSEQITARKARAAKAANKRCPRCGKVKRHAMFAKNRASKDGLYSICKECEAADRRKWKAAREAAEKKAAKPKPTARSRKPKPS